jgi:type IV secretion system protein VirB9
MFFLALLALIGFSASSFAAVPVTTDSRIKTFVYNPNEVFALTTHYGYQSNIEFSEKETIETISLGDRVAWQISPAGRRLFIRAQEENAHTNMTIVTNLRAYQFDLRSSAADAVFGSEQLTYVVRFFYPDEKNMTGAYAGGYSSAPANASSSALPPPMPVVASTTPPPIPTGSMPAVAPGVNYRYTFSGSDLIAPLKIYDDGKSTFFKFPAGVNPNVSVLTAKGEAVIVPTSRTADGLVSVQAIAPRFKVVQGADQVIVYNESGGVM